MDRSVMIAAIVAIVVVLAVTMLLNPAASRHEEKDAKNNSGSGQAGNLETADAPKGDNSDTGSDSANSADSGGSLPQDYEYDPNQTNIIGDYKKVDDASGCTLYLSSDPNEAMPYKCFGIANGIETKPPNYYHPAESDRYFCTATPTGCGTSEKVFFQWME